jgi:hypothetical protein
VEQYLSGSLFWLPDFFDCFVQLMVAEMHGKVG